MIDIGRVYNIVRDIANKDQKGFVTPNVFNSLAQVAQMNIYNEMFNELKLSVAMRRSGRDAGRDKSAYKMVEQDLSTYITNLRVGQDIDAYGEDLIDPDDPDVFITVSINPDGAFTFRRPRNMAQDISLVIDGTNISAEMVYDSEKVNRILNSRLSAPTDDFPICLVMDDVYQVFPAPSAGVILRYYRKPQSRYVTGNDAGLVDYTSPPAFVALTVNAATGQMIQDPQGSRNFDLPPQYLSEVVHEICELVGVSLRDPLLVQYSLGETKSE